MCADNMARPDNAKRRLLIAMEKLVDARQILDEIGQEFTAVKISEVLDHLQLAADDKASAP